MCVCVCVCVCVRARTRVYRKYKRAANISKLILTLDDIVFIDTQLSRKVRNSLPV